MSKKAILSALLVSSALLGTASANAATSALKDESKLVSVEKDGVKIYSNSKLESSKKVAKGTVYKVDGYRDINSKKYYRVYQQDTEGKNVYKGYVLAADAQDLKAGSVDKKDRFVGLTEDGQKAWKNLYFNREIKTYNGKKHSSNFEVKRTYEIGGKKYFSLYRGEKWMGYMDGSAFKVLTPEAIEEGKQAYTVAKDAKTYNDIYFTAKGELKAGEKVTVKRVYTFGTGRKYASAYNEAGKWVGYVNLSLLSEDKVADEETQKAIDAANDAIKKAEEILSKAQASKESKEAAQKVIDAAKETVKNGNLEDIKKVPSQIEEAIKALKPGATTIDIQKVEEAVKAGEEAIKQAEAEGIGSQNQPKVDNLKKAIEEGKKVIADMKKGDASTEDADKAVEAIRKAINDLKLPATSADIERLQQAIKEGTIVSNGTIASAVSGRDELNKAIEAGKKVLADAKEGKANGQDVEDAVKAIEEAIKNVKLNKADLIKQVQEVQKLAKNVYMTKDGEAKFVKAMTDIMNLPEDGINFNQFEEAKDVLVAAKKGLEKQPNKADGEALAKAIKEANGLKAEGTASTATEQDLEKAYNVANDLMTEMKKVTDKSNTATKEITKAEVEKATKDLNDAYAKYVKEAAKKAIEAADKKLNGDKLYAPEEEKAVKDAESALAGLLLDNNSDAASIKSATDKLNKAVEAMKTVVFDLADWKHTENEKQIVLESYTKPYAKDAKIVVPGMLKHKQIVLASQTKAKAGEKLFPTHEATDEMAGTVSIEFREVGGHKVKANDLYGAMINNKVIGTVDVTGLDTSATTNFNGLFMNDFYLKEVKGINHLVTSAATDLGGMFCNTALGDIDVSGWDTSNVTNMDRVFNKSSVSSIKGIEKWNTAKVTNFDSVFGGTDELTTLDLSGWTINKEAGEQASKNDNKNMFVSRDKSEESAIKEVVVPNNKENATSIVNALIKAEGFAGGLSHDVTVKTPDGKVIGTVKYVGQKPNEDKGQWEGKEDSSTSTTPSGSTTDSSTQK